MNLTHLLSFSSVMKSIGGVVLAVVILLVMVTIHEFGHYIAGKILNFKINEFSVGFGPALFKKRSKKSGELFALRAIPLGGYCAFEGEDDTEEENTKSASPKADGENPPFSDFADKTSQKEGTEAEPSALSGGVSPGEADSLKAEADTHTIAAGKRKEKKEPLNFNDQPPWKRIIVLLAGATMNYLLALLLIMVMFVGYGRPQSYLYPVEAAPQSQTATGADALRSGDIVLTVNGRDLYLTTDYCDALKGKKAGDVVAVEVLRVNEETKKREKLSLSVALQADANFSNMSDTATIYAVFGLDSERCQIVPVIMKQGFFKSVGDSFVYSAKIGGTVLRSLGELLTGKLGLSSMGGPVTTIKITSQVASSNMVSFLNIAGFIGVNLAVFNLLPIPALDGSKVIFCIIEWIRKKPINRKVEAMIHFIGIIFLFGFAILVDLLQLF